MTTMSRPAARVAGLMCALLLASCGGGSTLLFERVLEWTTRVDQTTWSPNQPARLTLARGASADLAVRVCPAVREYTDRASLRQVDYQPGRYSLSFENLPQGVRLSFPDGPLSPEAVPPGADGVPPANVRLVPTAALQGRTGAWASLPWAVPSAGDTTKPRYCYTHRVRLSRDPTSDDAAPVDVRMRLSVRYDDTVFPREVSLTAEDGDGLYERDARELFEPALRFDGSEVQAIVLALDGGDPPPPTGDGCTDGQPLSGRWIDAMAAPPALPGSGIDGLAAALLDDRPLIGRTARETTGTTLALDEWTGTRWQRTQVRVNSDADQLQLATGRDAGTGETRRLMAWRGVDFGRPLTEQAQVTVQPVLPDGRLADALPSAGSGPEFELRSLALVAWRGEPVVAWVRPDALVLRRHDGIGWLDLPAPARGTALGTPRLLRLQVDPSDDALVLVAATQAAEGTTRLRTWRLDAPGGRWQALPDVLAGSTSNPLATLVALALGAADGEVTLAWTWGEISFGGGTPLTLSVMRHGAAGWQPLGDPAALTDTRLGFALQPQQIELAAGCPGGAFIAWVEPGEYPEARIRGAQFGGAGAWDAFGQDDIATLDGGPAQYGAGIRLLSPADGRPLLVTQMSRAAGGEPLVGVRRYAAP